MTAENDHAPAEQPAPAPPSAPQRRPVVVPHINFEVPANENDLVSVRKGYGLTRPAESPSPPENHQEG